MAQVEDPVHAEPIESYNRAAADHGRAHEDSRGRSSRLANVRLATFLALAGALLAFDVLEGPGESVSLALSGILALVFLAQVVVHRKIRRVERWEGALAAVFREGLHRLSRHWGALADSLPEAEKAEPPVDADHPYAFDLDVTGRASLVRLTGPVTSERGRRILRSWLLDPGSPTDVRARQGAIRELAPQAEFRAQFTAHGRLEAPDTFEGVDTFLGWAEEPPWLLAKPWIRIAAWVLPALLIGAFVGDILFGMRPWWLLPGLAQLVVLRRVTPWAQGTLTKAAAGGPPLRALVPQLRLLSERTWEDPLLRDIDGRLGRGEHAAYRCLERLSKRLDTVESRLNMVYALLAIGVLLDVHVGVSLDRWRATHGASVRDWLDAAGEWEGLSSLATLAHDHPDWTYPILVDSSAAPRLEATALGHPLLPSDACVRNDVDLGPPGTFLLVTGSNMSGKSTLLRAIGTNTVLALAGAPVCSSGMSLPALRVHTSMRIDDSLSEGISLFMAELLRIKKIVQAAGDDSGAKDMPVLFLLDEILHGTNTAERRVAARGVVRHLLASGSVGAVSTHDLTLADAPDLKAASHAVHFREQVRPGVGGEGTRLTFDYTLREGIAETRNALKLLEAVGLGGLELDDEEA